QPQFLTFCTPNGPSDAERSATGEALRRALAASLEPREFVIDLGAGAWDPDWYFVARRGPDVLGVALVVSATSATGRSQRCCWSIGLEDGNYRNLNSDTLRSEINPVLESVVAGWPGVSAIRWHADATTLRDVMEPGA